jgi:hypothetical protein
MPPPPPEAADVATLQRCACAVDATEEAQLRADAISSRTDAMAASANTLLLADADATTAATSSGFVTVHAGSGMSRPSTPPPPPRGSRGGQLWRLDPFTVGAGCLERRGHARGPSHGVAGRTNLLALAGRGTILPRMHGQAVEEPVVDRRGRRGV